MSSEAENSGPTGYVGDSISSISPQATTQNGYIYPQWAYEQMKKKDPCGPLITFYVANDPINFAYESGHSLTDIGNYLINSKGWYDSGGCANALYVYDFTSATPGYKNFDKTVGKGGCTDDKTGRFHVRFWTMSNGRIVANGHHEKWDWFCLSHHVDGWDSAESQLASDETGQFDVFTDDYNLNNQYLPGTTNCPQGVCHDGKASTAPTTVTITSYPITDTFWKSHGIAVDTPLPVTWWPPYQSGYEFRVDCCRFTIQLHYYLDPGGHYVEEAASGFCPSYCWATTIYINVKGGINGVAVGAAASVDRNNHLRVSFTL